MRRILFAAVAASLLSPQPARAGADICGDTGWRAFNEQADLLTLFRARSPILTPRADVEADKASNAFAGPRYFARCLAGAIANGRDPAPYIESLRQLGAEDLKQ